MLLSAAQEASGHVPEAIQTLEGAVENTPTSSRRSCTWRSSTSSSADIRTRPTRTRAPGRRTPGST